MDYSAEITSIPNEVINTKLFEKKINRTLDNKIEAIIRPKKMSKSSRIHDCIKEIIMDSTIHALPKIYNSKRIGYKIMWFLMFLLTFTFNVQFTFRCINSYLSYETITQISIGLEQPGN